MNPVSLCRMDDDGTWVSTIIDDALNYRYKPQGHLITSSSTGQMLLQVRNETFIEYIDPQTLILDRTIEVDLETAYTAADFVSIDRCFTGIFPNALLQFTLWNGTDTDTGFLILNGTETSLDFRNFLIIPGRTHAAGWLYDVDGDSQDELFALSTSGQISLVEIQGAFSIEWTTTVSDSTPLAAAVLDFDGDTHGDFVFFTDEDERMTDLSFDGKVLREIFVGEVYGAVPINNIDEGAGEEVVVFANVEGGHIFAGAIRDLDWFYRLNVSVEFSPTEMNQRTRFNSDVDVRNIYNETVTDATLFMEIAFYDSGSPSTMTFGYFFNGSTNVYQLSVDSSWPIGVANLSIIADHESYHHWSSFYPDALTITSELSVDIYAEEVVAQGENQSITIWVTDSRGSPVLDANVTLEIGGIEYAPSVSEPNFVYENENVTLPAGEYQIFASAEHTYATKESNKTITFRVQTITENLVITDNLQRTLTQFDAVSSWFNITDEYGYTIDNADVSLRLGPIVFEMIERAPGCYFLERTFDVAIGYHSFELFIVKAGFENPRAAWVNVTVTGRLAPGAFFDPNVQADGNLNISITMKDNVGAVTEGTWVLIQVGDQNYTAIRNPEFPIEFSIIIPVNVGAGRNTLTLFAGATYASEVFVDNRLFYVHSICSADVTSSAVEWVITQGDQTEIFVEISDWLGLPVNVTSATLFLGTSTYSLSHTGPGAYSTMVSTSGWEPGFKNFTVFIQDQYVSQEEPASGRLVVKGIISISTSIITSKPTTGSPLEIEIIAKDFYNHPIGGLEINVEMAGLFAVVTETGESGRYRAFFEHAPAAYLTEGYTLVVTAGNELCPITSTNVGIAIDAATPQFSMSWENFGITSGLAFMLSLIGMMIYFKVSSSLNIEEESLENLEKSVKRLDRFYIFIIALTGAAGITSWIAYAAASYGIAVILAIAILGASVLLYGIWLYRDAISSVMVRDELHKGRMILGLWHLVFLPLVIVMILVYGVHIDWFKQDVIEAQYTFGEISIPSITTTIVTSFLSSIIVVVFNIYREISQGLKKIDRMAEAGTPSEVLVEERRLMVAKFSSSIRIKFLMFLVVVGAATAASLQFLAQYSIGVIILIPVVFLVLIPFLSSRILKALGFVKSKVSREEMENSSIM